MTEFSFLLHALPFLQVFKQARSDKDRVQYHVFVSSALMEYHCDKVCIVNRVLEHFGATALRKLFFAPLRSGAPPLLVAM